MGRGPGFHKVSLPSAGTLRPPDRRQNRESQTRGAGAVSGSAALGYHTEDSGGGDGDRGRCLDAILGSKEPGRVCKQALEGSGRHGLVT